MVFLRTHQPYSGTEVLMETKLERIAEISAHSPRPEFTSLYHLINKEIAPKLKHAAILNDIIHSDHCPVLVELI